MKRRPWLAALAGLTALTLVALALIIWREPVLGLFLQRHRLEDLVRRLGWLGPLAIIGLQATQVLVAPIPGQVVGLASGYLYGPWLGTLYSMAGLLLGTFLAVRIVRRWGRPIVERLVDVKTLARVDRLSGSLGLPLLFLVFLLPFLPDDTVLLVAGLTDIPLPGILWVAFFGRLPGVLVSSWLGAGAGSLTIAQWIAVAAVVVALAVPLYRYHGALEDRMWAIARRLSEQNQNHLPG